MANGKGLLPRPGTPPLINMIRPGRPELPADWASLTDDGIRERLREMGYSEKMIKSELEQYRRYRESLRQAPPEEPDTEPKPKSDLMSDIERHVKGG